MEGILESQCLEDGLFKLFALPLARILQDYILQD
jgi:hypothetical protein